jgi:predicted nucleic acid-binding protein
VSEAWVVNASPLILFSRVGRLDLIERLAPAILIPTAVVAEVHDGAAKDGTATKALEWAARFEVQNIEVPTGVSHWDLGSGESQVIAHAALGTRWAVLDDLAARRCALAHGVPVIGSMVSLYVQSECA